MRPIRFCLALLAGLLASPACSTSPAPHLDIPDGCNPIGADADCLLPYPSDFFRSDGPDGFRIALSSNATVAFGGNPVDFLGGHRADGFSVGSPILALFPQGIDDSNLVFWKENCERSREASSPTVLLDAETGERVLHFAEVDPRADTDARRALIIRPLVRLQNAHRYIVGIHALRDKTGNPVTPPKGFLNLRDQGGTASPKLAALAPHYQSDIFPKLEAAGVARSTLQLAWDFTTASEESTTKDMLDIRADVMARISASPPVIKIVSVEDNPPPSSGQTPTIGRRIQATVTVPLYVDSDMPGAKLVYDASGKVSPQGTTDVPFTIWIPISVMNKKPGDPPARIFQFGHGFLGSRDEVNDFPAEFANEKGFVIVAADWWGLSSNDISAFTNAIAGADINGLVGLTDRIHQAMANFMYVAAAAKGPLANFPQLSVNGSPAYDPTHLYYYGISMGGVLGGMYSALSPFIDRSSLSVNGMDWSLMMFRSAAFAGLLLFINVQQSDPLEQQKFVALFQSLMDRIDPMTYTPHLLANRFPGGPPTLDVAMQIGMGDALVPNVASFMEARTLGIPVLQPSPIEPCALTTVPSPAIGSAMTIFDFGVQADDLAEVNISANNPVHEGVRRAQGSKDQVDLFFHPGAPVTQACGGPCVVKQ